MAGLILTIIIIYIIVFLVKLSSRLRDLTDSVKDVQKDVRKLLLRNIKRDPDFHQDIATEEESLIIPEIVTEKKPDTNKYKEELTPPPQPKPETTKATIRQKPALEVSSAVSSTISKPETKPEKETKRTETPKETAFAKVIEGASETARDIVKSIWNWLLVGEEHRPKHLSAEVAIASTWLMRLGVIAIVTCVGYFLNRPLAEGLSAHARVTVCVITGLGLLTLGINLAGKKYDTMGQGFLGGGIAVLFLSVFAAGIQYALVPVVAAFLLVILVTLTAGVLSVRTNSMLISILGLIGGYCTPIMLATGPEHFGILYTFLLFLTLGVFGLAHFKQWRLLNYLAFIFNYAVAIRALRYYTQNDFVVVLPLLSAFFILHSWLVFYNNILKRRKSTVLELIHIGANSAIYSITAYFLIEHKYPGSAAAIMTFCLALFYAVHVFSFLKRGIIDRNLLLTLMALSALFSAITMPIVLEKETLTVCLSMLALTYLWLGRKMKSNFIEAISYTLYAIVFFRLIAWDLPSNYDLQPAPLANISEYWKLMFNRLWEFGVPIATIFFGFKLTSRTADTNSAIAINPGNDTKELVPRPIILEVLYWFGILFAFIFAHLEFNHMFKHYEPLRLTTLTALWCGMAFYFLDRFRKTNRPVMMMVMIAFASIALLKLLSIDILSWRPRGAYIFGIDYDFLSVGIRFLDFGLILAFFFGSWRFFANRPSPPKLRSCLGYTGLGVLTLYLTLETNNALFHLLPGFQKGGVTTLWALLAASYLTGGILKKVALLRYIGLSLFGIAAAKIVLVDLADIRGIYRVSAFLCMGIFLLIGAFIYIYASNKADEADKEQS